MPESVALRQEAAVLISNEKVIDDSFFESIRNFANYEATKKDKFNISISESNNSPDYSTEYNEQSKINKPAKILKLNSMPTSYSFYKDASEYEGVVDNINIEENTFSATLIERDSDSRFSAEFDIDDMQYKSDSELLEVGARFILVIGQEVSVLRRGTQFVDGPLKNISKIVFRRTRGLNSKSIKDADDRAAKWTAFFNGL